MGEMELSKGCLVTETEGVYLDQSFNEYTLYCYSVHGKQGSIISLPFFTFDKDHKQEFVGYLIYHFKESYGFGEKDLEVLFNTSLVNYSLSGMVAGVEPLPYKPISEEKIDSALEELLDQNLTIDLSKPLSL